MNLTLEQWRKLARIGHAASEDDARPPLTKLHLKAEDWKLSAEATDSYIAAKTTLDVLDADPWDGLVSARQALLIEKDVRSLDRYRSRKDVPDSQILLTLDFQEEWVDITLSEDGTLLGPEKITRRLEVAPFTSFPKVSTLISKAHKRRASAGVSAVALTAEVFQKLAQASPAVDGYKLKLSFGKTPTDPIAVRSHDDSNNWQGVIMPVRFE